MRTHFYIAWSVSEVSVMRWRAQRLCDDKVAWMNIVRVDRRPLPWMIPELLLLTIEAPTQILDILLRHLSVQVRHEMTVAVEIERALEVPGEDAVSADVRRDPGLL